MNSSSLCSLILILAMTTGCIADIRPDMLQSPELDQAPLEARGRALLTQVADAHGEEAWSQVKTYTMEVHDRWQGMLVKRQSPWGEPEVDLTLNYLAGTFDGRAVMRSGQHEGETWGVQSWQTYVVDTQGTARFAHDDDIAFIVPALHYLQEFVFRAGTAPIVLDAGEDKVGDTLYQRVFVTWHNLEPHMEADQYIMYINPDTHRVAKIQYTVRDAMRFLQGTIHFDDFRLIEGVWVPFTQSVTLSLQDDPVNDYLHLMTLRSMRFNEVDPSIFRVDPKLEAPGDRKP